MSDGRKMLTIPHPLVRPLGYEITRDSVRAVWDTWVKPVQDSGELQSIEDRILTAILRALYEGLDATEAEPDE